MRSGVWGRRVGRVSLLVLALLIAAPAVRAGDPPPPVGGASGRTGVHAIVESEGAPAAICRYGYEVEGLGYYNGVRRIRLGAPVAYAAPGRTGQVISARVVVQYWDGGAWVRYAATGWQRRFATPTATGTFTARSLVVDSWPHHNTVSSWRVRLDLRWHGRDRVSVTGRAWLFPHWYDTWEGSQHLPLQTDTCGGTTG